MSKYFKPDRSNRPGTSDKDGTREIKSQEPALQLGDGRPVVREQALVDGFHCIYYYFDASGLEDATQRELATKLHEAGLGREDRVDEGKVYFSAEMALDARGRKIWEIQVTYPPLD